MKYIIDVPDEAIEFMGGRINVFVEPECKVGDCKHYALRISKGDIEPYTEPDRKAIEDEVWEFVVKCLKMDGADFYEIFDSCNVMCWTDISYREAKAKYDEWKKQNDEICVGDEVELFGGAKGLVYIVGEEMLEGAYSNCDWLLPFCWRKKNCRKTGRHFPEIAELLKKIRGEEE